MRETFAPSRAAGSGGASGSRRAADSWRAVAALAIAVLLLSAMAPAASARSGPAVSPAAAGYPPSESGYHDYDEMVQHIHAVAAAHPDIVKLFSIGKSYKGRRIWAAKVSDHVKVDENEPEVLFDGLHHAREHLSGEMTISLFDLLTSKYGQTSKLGRRVTQ